MSDYNRDDRVSLGDKVEDRITGYCGILVCSSDWLNGCKRLTIQSQELHDGCPIASQTFDAEQVVLVTVEPKPEEEPTGGPSISPTRNPDPM